MKWTDNLCSWRGATMIAALAIMLGACSDDAPQQKSESIPAKPDAAVASTPQADPYQTPGGTATTAAPAAATKSQAPPIDPNKALAAKVKSALEAEPRVNGQGIDVTAAEGVVSLWGTVADAAERNKAEAVAAAQPGVKSVANKLAIVKGS